MIPWPFHRHRFFEVDRQWMEKSQLNLEGKRIGDPTPITVITERCAEKLCGDYRQQTLKGHLPGGNYGPTFAAQETLINE